MSTSTLKAAAIALLPLVLAGPPLAAAELEVPPHGVHARAHVPRRCGPCGCLRVTYVYHRELKSTYGLSYDPRNYDQTEPHYYLGPVHAYPRYFVDGELVPGSC